ncbi:N-acetylmuramic acid 6-phosphate etherase [Rhodohalobacter sp. SW132]|uniref:N-acetylmuramic acid 6-phosphate etherase n=1 Tax=Rhodohalobacter sp. SW132 TaxID=2293433 RepID=UPI000E224A98|nr:N-acetylmuramic acid 6-phosphate etherase [Rhodohalobacter sp. SW132]REL38327.1 N-acetylmuramic acid 6-phosphate etherase [Rhodohalobacter sp. SW132]
MNRLDRDLFDKLSVLLTEQRNPETMRIDMAGSYEIVKQINREDKKVAEQVEYKLPVIAEAVETIALKIKEGGRLLYFGAGTSGRLGILDASECPPTFGTAPDIVQGFIAGGKEAVFVSQEGAEDSLSTGREEVKKAKVTDKDVVVGLAASGRTPYVHGAVLEAKERGAITAFITTVSADQVDIRDEIDFMIDVPVGPEVIMGSTRMKSGTAQKMVLNMLSTGAMIRLGKVYENVMVDLQLSNKKLEERAKRIVMLLTDCTYETAENILMETDGHVKTALVMILTNSTRAEAENRLAENNGFVRASV